MMAGAFHLKSAPNLSNGWGPPLRIIMPMTKDELKMIHSYIDLSHNYLEFGSGESTIYASTAPMIKSIDSVESSEGYISEYLKPNTAITNALSTGKLLFHIIDIGETIAWGYPKNELKKHLWPNYSLSVFTKKSNHDLALVDGRFRVACTLNCILNTPENCTIIIHDFWSRPEYHIVLKYLELKDKVETLGVFSKKQDTDLIKLQSLIKKYQYLPKDRTLVDKIKRKLTKRYK
ncbi:MAG: hypothetical protein Q7U10_00965 [Thermodesulfovibrionia bacterium]|nr:hypothetical protein [Thermodesulfovibrionia bacterium]